jgi:hypothetical protein
LGYDTEAMLPVGKRITVSAFGGCKRRRETLAGKLEGIMIRSKGAACEDDSSKVEIWLVIAGFTYFR